MSTIPLTPRFLGPHSRIALGVSALFLALACSWREPSRAADSHLQIRVPASVLAAHTSELPLNLFVRRTPGTLENRGFLLATICSAGSDVVTTYVESFPVDTELTVWLEGGYADNPGTPCGVGIHPHDLIVEGPRRHPQTSLRIAPAANGSVVLSEFR